MRDVYADQWKSCADLMRAKAVEFDKLAESAPIRPKEPIEVTRAIVDARSFVDLAKGHNFPDEFVRDMAKCLARCADLLAGDNDDAPKCQQVSEEKGKS